MGDGLPVGVERRVLPEGERYVLPRRPALAGNRIAGAALMGIGCFGGVLMLMWIGGALAFAFQAEALPGRVLGIFFALLGLPGLAVAMVPLGLGMLLAWGRSVIELVDGQVRCIDRAGPIHWTVRRPLGAVRRLNVGQPLALKRRRGGEPAVTRGDNRYGAIEVECADSKPMLMALGYEIATLKPLADELAARIGTLAPSPVIGGGALPVVLVESLRRADMGADAAAEEPGVDDARSPLPDHPAGSAIRLERRADGVTITVPPAGLGAGSAGLFGFGCLWTGFMALFTLGFIFAEKQGGEVWPLLIFFVLFWSIGLGMMLAGVNMARRQAVIDIAGGDLFVTHRSLFGVKQRQWRAEELLDVRYAPSGMKSNKVDIMQVQVVPRTGKPAGFFTGRSDEELHWLSAVLRRELKLGAGGTPAWRRAAQEQGGAIPDRLEGSAIVVERRSDGVSVTIPPAGVKFGGAIGVGMMFILITGSIGAGFFFLADDGDGPPLPVYGFLGLFVAIGVALVAVGVSMGRRRAAIDIVGDHLLVTSSGLFGTKQQDWAAADLSEVVCTESGVEVNHVPLMQLQIVPTAGKPFKLMTGRDTEEIEWVAAIVREELGVAGGEEDGDEDEDAESDEAEDASAESG